MNQDTLQKWKASTSGKKKIYKKTTQKDMEDEIVEYIRDLRKNCKRVTTWIIWRKAMKIKPDFCDYGKNKEKLKSWFYYGFKKRKNLSWTRISGASRKLPNGQEKKAAQIIERVARVQSEQHQENIIIPRVKDDNMCNTNHVPVYINMSVEYSWGERNTGGRQVATGGKEKSRITVQLSICKSGRKLRPTIIYKGAIPPPEGERLKKKSIAYELFHRNPDKAGNLYPPKEDVHLMVNTTAKSSGQATIEVLEEVIFPEIGIQKKERGAMLVDDFKGHSTDDAKNYVKSVKSDGDKDVSYDLCSFLIMSSGITPMKMYQSPPTL